MEFTLTLLLILSRVRGRDTLQNGHPFTSTPFLKSESEKKGKVMPFFSTENQNPVRSKI